MLKHFPDTFGINVMFLIILPVKPEKFFPVTSVGAVILWGYLFKFFEGAIDVEGGPTVKSEGVKFAISKEPGGSKLIRVSFICDACVIHTNRTSGCC